MSESEYIIFHKYWNNSPEGFCRFMNFVHEHGGKIQYALSGFLNYNWQVISPSGEVNSDWTIKILTEYLNGEYDVDFVGLAKRAATSIGEFRNNLTAL